MTRVIRTDPMKLSRSQAEHCRELFARAEQLAIKRGRFDRERRYFRAYVADLEIYYAGGDDLTICAIWKRDDRTMKGRRGVLGCNVYADGECDVMTYHPGGWEKTLCKTEAAQ